MSNAPYNAYVVKEFLDTDYKQWIYPYDEYFDTLEEARAAITRFKREICKDVENGYGEPGLFVGRIKDAEGWVIEKRWEI